MPRPWITGSTKTITENGDAASFTPTRASVPYDAQRIFSLTLRATQGLLDSLFELMNVQLCAPDYSCVSKRARTVKVAYRQPPKGRITDLVIDSTGLKVFGEGEWKVRKHGAEKRRVWRKLHLAVDPVTHYIVAAEVSLENVHDAEMLPTLLNPLRRKLGRVYADVAYDSKASHRLIARKGATACIPPRKNAGLWKKGHPRNEAVLEAALWCFWHGDDLASGEVLLGVLLGRDERVRLVYGLLVGAFYMDELFRPG